MGQNLQFERKGPSLPIDQPFHVVNKVKRRIRFGSMLFIVFTLLLLCSLCSTINSLTYLRRVGPSWTCSMRYALLVTIVTIYELPILPFSHFILPLLCSLSSPIASHWTLSLSP